MSDLTDLLTQYRNASATEREKGTYFEELIRIITAPLKTNKLLNALPKLDTD